MKPSLEDEDNDSREQSTARAFETRSSLANAAKQVDRLKISEEKSIFYSKKKKTIKYSVISGVWLTWRGRRRTLGRRPLRILRLRPTL